MDETRILVLPDDSSMEIARPALGQIVAIYAERPNGWLEVEVPGGFAVWVFGRYLAPTADPEIFEVTGNAVNLRPGPSTAVTCFPLLQRLQAGEKVRAIERLDPDSPLSETWVRVWSPPGVHGFLRNAQVQDLAENEAGALLWAAALDSMPRSPSTADQRMEASATGPKSASAAEPKDLEAWTALQRAREALEGERTGVAPDYASVEAALNAVVAQGGTLAPEARAELRKLSFVRESAALIADLERERQHRREASDSRAKSRERDPLGDAFAARGVVVCRTGNDKLVRFYLRSGGEMTLALTCTSGRYDLSTFAGVEVGLKGIEDRSRKDEISTFDVERIEVLSVPMSRAEAEL